MKTEFFYNNLTYKIHDHKPSVHGITALLESPSGNWIVANGVNIMNTTEFDDITLYQGDWNHGHYFMNNKLDAMIYFLEVQPPVEDYWKY